MPSLFQLLVIAGVALVVLVLWRYLRASAARSKDASIPTGKRYERRKRQRRVRRSHCRWRCRD
jgi:threonine/homoserine/homoserine lactone efflux protein